MKSTLLPLLLIFSLAPLHAQNNEEEKGPDVTRLLPGQKEFLNMPLEKREEFAKSFGEAARKFQQKRIFECLEDLDKAEKIFSESAELHNLRGSCYVEMRAFDKAMAAFQTAAKIDPENVSLRFNIGEVYFVTRQWQEAHDAFSRVIKEIPPENLSLARLVEFKILLSKLKLGQDDEVVMLAEKYDFQDDSPYYYYSKAALAYDNEDLPTAEEWLARAGRIFRDPNIIAPWQDTLVEFGYIKSFYGDDTPVE